MTIRKRRWAPVWVALIEVTQENGRLRHALEMAAHDLAVERDRAERAERLYASAATRAEEVAADLSSILDQRVGEL
jgi:hypothetical protein